tara:strand:- start:4871 stop:5389 length:519 start_codon:yes stop_codon:yes gene_type:complete
MDVKEYTVYDFEDLKQDDELCDRIYQKFWLENSNNINPWSDENLDSFKLFAETLNMKFDCSLSNAEYPDRGCYIKLIPNYHLDNKDYKEILQDYKGNGYCFCDDLKTFTNKLLDKKEYKVLCEWSTNDFVLDIQNKMFEMWFADNQEYFSKEMFLNHVESNEYEFDENGNLF